MSSVRLSATSHAVLGMVAALGPSTPYDLKQFAEVGLFHFWSIPHTQVYSECSRLSAAGLLEERREETGRRRRVFSLTAAGRAALEEWRRAPEAGALEVRDEALLKLFLGADRRALAERQLAVHRPTLEQYEALDASADGEMPAGMRSALQAGIAIERAYVRFWEAMRGAG